MVNNTKMDRIRVGVLGPSGIAKRRMVPAILKSGSAEYVGVAIAVREEWGEDISQEQYREMWVQKQEKAQAFAEAFGGRVFEGYEALLQSGEIDAVYIPLPPALHFKWAKRALECGKHVLLEKPFTINGSDTAALVNLAEKRRLAVLENYGFVYHGQIAAMKEVLESGEIGELRLLRADFGFPYRGKEDFRYSAAAGGGALWDCGGYTVKAAECFLKGNIRVRTGRLNYLPDHDVDIYGSVTLEDERQCTAQLFFGMDDAYVCELELWGSRGIVSTKRAFTAPDTLDIQISVRNAEGERTLTIPAEDQFLKCVDRFAQAAGNGQAAGTLRQEILSHGVLMDRIFSASRGNDGYLTAGGCSNE